jgi:uncharacterized protein
MRRTCPECGAGLADDALNGSCPNCSAVWSTAPCTTQEADRSDVSPAVVPITPSAIPKNVGAVPEPERIASIDVLRGFAVLGILLMNIQSFSMVDMAYDNPHIYGDLSGANYWVWYLCHVFADQKFMTIFSMLFGAGIVLMTNRQEAAVGRSAAVHYRRMGVLLLFGLVHAYLIWYGDILTAYAVCGMAAYLFRKVRPWILLVVGCLVISVYTGLMLGAHQILPYLPEQREEFIQSMQPSAEEITKELEAYRGGWMAEMRARAPDAFQLQTVLFLLFMAWRAGGLMLVGMALFKLGFFSAKRSPGTYLAMIAAGLLIGVPIIIYGENQITQRNWEPIYTKFIGDQFNYWGSIPLSLAYVGFIMLICRQPRLQAAVRPLAAAGQMALTNYLLQSVICTTIFYGHGFGLFGRVERVGQIGIVLAVWIFELTLSPVWLSYFRFGPAEWMWRALTYGKLPALRRSVAGAILRDSSLS